MTRYQPRSLEPLLTDALHPPGEHITFPEVAWPAAAAEPPPPMQPARPRDVPLVIGMIEPEPNHGRLAPLVFWALVVMSFACVLAKAGGWL